MTDTTRRTAEQAGLVEMLNTRADTLEGCNRPECGYSTIALLRMAAAALSAHEERAAEQAEPGCPYCGGPKEGDARRNGCDDCLAAPQPRSTEGVPVCKHGVQRGYDCGLCDLGNGFETERPAQGEAEPVPGVYSEEQASKLKREEQLYALLQRAETDLRIDAVRYAESGHKRAAENREKTADRIKAYRDKMYNFGRR